MSSTDFVRKCIFFFSLETLLLLDLLGEREVCRASLFISPLEEGTSDRTLEVSDGEEVAVLLRIEEERRRT